MGSTLILFLILVCRQPRIVSHQPGGFGKLLETLGLLKHMSGLVTLKHMSAAGLGASLKLVTHLHQHTKLWIVSAPWRNACWHMPGVALLLQLPIVELSALINVRMVRGIAEELDSCAGTSMNLICRDLDLCVTLVLDSRVSVQVKSRIPGSAPKFGRPSPHPPQLAEALAFLLTPAARRGNIHANEYGQ